MQQPPARARIEDVGLAQFLDETSYLHSNLGYDNFVSMVGPTYLTDPQRKTKVDKANIGKAFDVSRYTIHRWLKIYEAENKKESEK